MAVPHWCEEKGTRRHQKEVTKEQEQGVNELCPGCKPSTGHRFQHTSVLSRGRSGLPQASSAFPISFDSCSARQAPYAVELPRSTSMSINLHVWGDFACFTRPEMKVERVSYDLITPSAARGMVEAVYWKPEIRWRIDRIHVLKPIRFTSLRRNEV